MPFNCLVIYADPSETLYRKPMIWDTQCVNMATDQPDYHSNWLGLLVETYVFTDGCFTKGIKLFEILIDLIEKYVANTLVSAKDSKVKVGKFVLTNVNEPLSKSAMHFLSSKECSTIT